MKTFTNACFFLVLLFFVFSAHAQNSMQFDAIHSGFVKTSNENVTGDLEEIKAGGNAGFMTFDLTGLPSGAVITAVTLSISASNITVNIPPPTNLDGAVTFINKNTANASVTHNEVKNGPIMGTINWDGGTTTKTINFSAAGISQVQSKSGAKLGLGIRAPLNNNTYEYTFAGYASNYVNVPAPVLTITYSSATGSAPIADFYAASTSVRIDSSVLFYDNSGNSPTGWEWNFGDGNTSTLKNPGYYYSATGTYTVSLKATNAQGNNTITKTNYITIRPIPPPPIADFKADNVNPLVNTPVLFSDSTKNNPTEWQWSFGDGGNSTDQHPEHTYTSVGIYTVVLITTGPGGSDTVTKENYIHVLGQLSTPVAEFGYMKNNLEVFFSDSSANAPSDWEWDFDNDNNPGLYTSTSQNSLFTYATPGTYKVCLSATNAAGTDTHCEYITVQLNAAPEAEFSASVTGKTATFTDFSNNGPTAWSWTFGDTQTSALQNPTHTYTGSGNYVVCLDASNAYGSDTKCKTITVTATGLSSDEAGITVFPNPASDRVFILAPGLDFEQTRVTLLNMLGETITPVVSRNGDLLELDLKGLKSGIYFIRIEGGNKVLQTKLLIDSSN